MLLRLTDDVRCLGTRNVSVEVQLEVTSLADRVSSTPRVLVNASCTIIAIWKMVGHPFHAVYEMKHD